MSDISKNYISSREAATITGVHIATIRRMCKKLLKSSDPAMREMCQKKYEEGSEKFEYMIDKDFALNKWKNPETYSAPTSNSNAPQSSTDRALDIMEKVVSSLVEQNKELKEQNKKFYELISEQRDDLGCLKTVSGDGLDHQCRTEALLRIQIQETKKLTNNLYGI
jgi:hypothetical protein